MKKETASKKSDMFTDREREVAGRLQGDIPIVDRPFQEIGAATGHTEEEVLALIAALRHRGTIRKFGAVVRHQRVGFTSNAMIAWAVPPDRVEAAGLIMAAHKEITHCYERRPAFLGRYNLFSMAHGRGKDLDALITRLVEETAIGDYLVLKSEEELKKISMEYFG